MIYFGTDWCTLRIYWISIQNISENNAWWIIVVFNKAHFIQMLHILACSITIQMSNTSSMHSGTLMLGFGFCTVDTQILLNGNNDVVFNDK